MTKMILVHPETNDKSCLQFSDYMGPTVRGGGGGGFPKKRPKISRIFP